jgi:hydroxymethylbilane synthase
VQIKIGTRGSKLALTQTKMVAKAIKEAHPHIEVELVIIQTQGDRVTHLSLDQIGGRGVFVKEIEAALLIGEIDVAVHSMKDMPSNLHPELCFAKSPKREDPRDVLITPHHIKSVMELPTNARIGTGSKRRRAELHHMRADLQMVDIRGNIDTRIEKMLVQELDGIILAAAGLNRMGIKSCEEYQLIPLAVEEMLPSPGQGALAIQYAKHRKDVGALLEALAHTKTNQQLEAERAFLKTLQGSCHVPLGAYAHIEQDTLSLTGLFGEGEYVVKKTKQEHLENRRELGENLAKELIEEVKRWKEKSI